jgi:hypothetical protein
MNRSPRSLALVSYIIDAAPFRGKLPISLHTVSEIAHAFEDMCFIYLCTIFTKALRSESSWFAQRR